MQLHNRIEMKLWLLIMMTGVLGLASCNKKNSDVRPEGRFVPTDVIVKTKSDFTVDKVFDFINTYDHDVELLYNGIYTSELPSDSLQYVLDYLNKKTYTHENEDWPVSGYLHYKSQVITIFPRLIDMKDRSNQTDWLQSMKILRLKEVIEKNGIGGNMIHFHVPASEEKTWVAKFRKLSFVEWAELNYYADIVPL